MGSRDVIVVGGGVIGLACAWRLAREGLSVAVLERGAPGGGATGVSAGMLAPVTEAAFGEERLLALTREAAAAWPAFADALGHHCGYRRTGALAVALDRDELAEVRRQHDFRTALGLAGEWATPAQARELEPALSPACAGGAFTPDEGEVDPRRLVKALLAALEREGAEVHAGAEAAELLVESGRAGGVRTADGTRHRAVAVVAATGAWSGVAPWLPRAARPPVRPVKGQILRLRVEEPVCERIVRTLEVYVVPRADGEVVVGATVEERGFDTRVTAGAVHELLRAAYRLLPELAEAELVEAAAGLRPGTPDNLPRVGPGAVEGLVLATGHYRNGVLLAPTTAEAVAGLVVPVAA